MSRKICVVGSVNMDLVVEGPRLPRAGETITGSVFHAFPGGKGANQAVAAARLGADTTIVGCVGDDAWGSELRATFAAQGIHAQGLVTVAGQNTGSALVAVVPGGDNATIVAPGANDALTPEIVSANADAIAGADMLLVQLESPLASVARAIDVATAADTAVLLYASPARELASELLDRVALLVVGEEEGRALTGCEHDVEAAGIARRLKAKVSGRVFVTLGSRGALAFDGETKVSQESFDVERVDTTAAGDAFCAALAVATVEGQRVDQALRFACAAGSLTTTRFGAIPSLPTREEVEGLLTGVAT